MAGASARRSPREIKARIVEAMWEQGTPALRPCRETGEFVPGPPGGQWDIDYAGDCERAVLVNRASEWDHLERGIRRTDVAEGRLFETNDRLERGFFETTLKVRCRKCTACLNARTRMWVARAAQETALTAAMGLRTWFGTLTFRPEVHDLHEQLAFEQWAEAQPGASVSKARFDALEKDERFSFVRAQALVEVQRYWKRLRKAGCAFRYFVVFEPHKSGRVHMHWLLHERGAPILYRQLEAAWGRGHTKVVLVGGRSKRSGPPRRAAFYVAKYLSKSYQSRQLASQRYGRSAPVGRKSAKPPKGIDQEFDREIIKAETWQQLRNDHRRASPIDVDRY